MTYILYDIEDRWYACICLNESDLQLCLANIFEKRPFPTVLEYEVDGWCHDRTEEMREKYAPKPTHDEYDDDKTANRRWNRERAGYFSFGKSAL